MTVGAAILDWVQPTRATNYRPAIELIARGNTINQPWTTIRVGPQRPGNGTKTGETHFIVDREGTCTATDYWLDQKRFGNEPVVRVSLAASAGSNEVALPQWWAAQELIAALQRACSIPQRHVILDDTLALPLMASAQPTGKSRP